MLTTPLACTKCRTPLTEAQFASSTSTVCRNCGAEIHGTVFPAFLHDLPPSDLGQDIDGEGQASCFHHPSLQAEKACDYCGRFLCKLCDITFTDKHVCPSCIERMATHDYAEQFTRNATNWDAIAFWVACCVFLGPIVITLYILARRTQKVAPRVRALGLTALVMGIVETIGLLLLILMIWNA